MKSGLTKRLAVALGAMSLALAAFAPSTIAADTRLIVIGDGSSCADTAQDPNGALYPTSVSAGALTEFSFSWENCGTQNLSNAILTVGTFPGAFNTPASPFADGTTFFDDFSSSGSDKGCTLNADRTLLTCSYKSIRPGTGGDLTIVLTASTTATSLDAYVALKVNENTNDGGSNQDTFEAVGSTPIAAASCDGVQTYLYRGNPRASTCDVAPGNPQSEGVGYDAAGQIDLHEGASGNSCTVGTKTQIGSDVIASIDGDTPANLVTWTIVIDVKALGMNSIKASDVAVCHWNDAGTLVAPSNIQATKSNKGILTVTFTTNGNGSSRILS